MQNKNKIPTHFHLKRLGGQILRSSLMDRILFLFFLFATFPLRSTYYLIKNKLFKRENSTFRIHLTSSKRIDMSGFALLVLKLSKYLF